MAYLALAALAAFGGARPTGLAWLDPVLLAAGGAGLAAAGARARTTSLYVAAGVAAIVQPATLPMAVGVAGLGVAFARRTAPRTGANRGRRVAGSVAAGLAFAATVGAPGAPPGAWWPLAAGGLGLILWSARRNGSRRFRRRFTVVTGMATVVLLAAAGAGVVAVVGARTHLERGNDLVESGLDAARAGDTQTAARQLRAAHRALGRGEASLGAPWARPAWAVPGLGQNIRALHTLTADVRRLAAAGIRTVDDAALEQVQVRAGQVDLAAVASLADPLTEVIAELGDVRERFVDAADAWLLPPIEHRLASATDQLDRALSSAELALDGVRITPPLLGADGPRTYLVLFTTPVEARSRTGFPGNYAEVIFTDGRFEMVEFGRVLDLNDRRGDADRSISGPPDFLARYGRFQPERDWRNVALSPDFPTIAAVAAELYPQSGGGPIDGVMAIDPRGLAALLELTGPIAVPGIPTPLDAENAAQFLLRDQYLELPDTPDRVDVLETLAEMTFDRLTTVDLPTPQRLGEVLGPAVERGNLKVVAFGEDEEPFLGAMGTTGRLREVAGDFLAVSTSNAAGNKIDLFLRRATTYEATWDADSGELTATATITLTNRAPAGGLPHYLIGNNLGNHRLDGTDLPLGWNNVYLTLYTPWEQVGATVDGEQLLLEAGTELGRRAYSAFVPLGPGETRTISVALEGHLQAERYLLDLAPQPMVRPEEATVGVEVRGLGPLTTTGPVDGRGPDLRGTFPLVRDTRITATRS